MPLRVAITAASIRTALGDDPAAVQAALAGGRTAVGPVRGFDASGFGAVRAAQVAGEEEAPEDDPALRILGFHGRLLDAVALEAHAAAHLAGVPRERVGLFAGMGMVDSPLVDLVPAAVASRDAAGAFDLGAFFAGGYRQVHPLWPLAMLNNVAAGQIAIDLDIRGDNLVLAPDAVAGLRALLEAAWSVDEGACDAALAAGVSTRVSPARLARLALSGAHSPAPPGEGAGAIVLEGAEHARRRGRPALGWLRGGVTLHGGDVREALRALADAAGLGPEALRSAGAPAPEGLGDLEAADAPVRVALLLAGWRASRVAGEPPRTAVVACRAGASGGALVIEEAA